MPKIRGRVLRAGPCGEAVLCFNFWKVLLQLLDVVMLEGGRRIFVKRENNLQGKQRERVRIKEAQDAEEHRWREVQGAERD